MEHTEGLNKPNQERWVDGWVEHDEVYAPTPVTCPLVGGGSGKGLTGTKIPASL